MRTIANSQDFADWLIKLGNGSFPPTPGLGPDAIEIPPEFLLRRGQGSLINHVFADPTRLLEPEGQERIKRAQFFAPRTKTVYKSTTK